VVYGLVLRLAQLQAVQLRWEEAARCLQGGLQLLQLEVLLLLLALLQPHAAAGGPARDVDTAALLAPGQQLLSFAGLR
jgi:hypothetical protein